LRSFGEGYERLSYDLITLPIDSMYLATKYKEGRTKLIIK
jgi:hypothetical protein